MSSKYQIVKLEGDADSGVTSDGYLSTKNE